MIRDQIRKDIYEAILNAIYNKSDIAFRSSQAKVPVITGALKRSGSIAKNSDGAKIEYKMDYSSFVEHGIKGGMQEVRGHYRRDGSYVKSFSRYMPMRKGKFFIGSSVKESFADLALELSNQLRIKGFRVVKR